MSESPGRAELPPDSPVIAVAQAIADAGGRALLVGGWPRDRLLGLPARDLDMEIFGLRPERIDVLLERFGSSGRVGRHFAVWRIPSLGLDLSPPRTDADGFDGVRCGASALDSSDPAELLEAFRAAACHRDLTINAIGWDPLSSTWFDPWHGREDLATGRLRAVDASTFARDPLRLLRVARFEARFGFRADESLVDLCRSLDLRDVPPERVAGELRRILTESDVPSRAFRFLERVGRLDVVPPIHALQGVPQDPRWHPEGDVFVHTMRVIDCAATLAQELEVGEGELLLWAALCHDLGKPETTTVEGDRIRALRHELPSARIARRWLESLRLPNRLIERVVVLVLHHLAPPQFVSNGAGARAYRRLARKLAVAHLTVVDLERLARADQLGRTTEEARRGSFDAGRIFLEAARAAGVEAGPRPDVVHARDLMAQGIAPGPALGRALARCRELQDDRGWEEPEVILRQVLREGFQGPDGSS